MDIRYSLVSAHNARFHNTKPMIFEHTCQGEVGDQLNDEANQRESAGPIWARVVYNQPSPKCNKAVANLVFQSLIKQLVIEAAHRSTGASALSDKSARNIRTFSGPVPTDNLNFAGTLRRMICLVHRTINYCCSEAPLLTRDEARRIAANVGEAAGTVAQHLT